MLATFGRLTLCEGHQGQEGQNSLLFIHEFFGSDIYLHPSQYKGIMRVVGLYGLSRQISAAFKAFTAFSLHLSVSG